VGVAVMGMLMTRALHGVPLPRGREVGAGRGAGADQHDAQSVRRRRCIRYFSPARSSPRPALLAALFLPPVDFTRGVRPNAGEELLTAEMTNLETGRRTGYVCRVGGTGFERFEGSRVRGFDVRRTGAPRGRARPVPGVSCFLIPDP
jgi:hypothetical protein